MYDDEIYDLASNKWLREVDPPRKAQPSDQEAHKVFIELLSVSEEKQTALISVSIEHLSPDIAKQWVELMVSRVSEDLRSKDIREAEESIKFLEAQREKTSLVSLDEVFAQLIEEQTKTIMLANVSKDYVFDVIDPPVAPELKSKPSPSIDLCARHFARWDVRCGGRAYSTLWKDNKQLRSVLSLDNLIEIPLA